MPNILRNAILFFFEKMVLGKRKNAIFCILCSKNYIYHDVIKEVFQKYSNDEIDFELGANFLRLCKQEKNQSILYDSCLLFFMEKDVKIPNRIISIINNNNNICVSNIDNDYILSLNSKITYKIFPNIKKSCDVNVVLKILDKYEYDSEQLTYYLLSCLSEVIHAEIIIKIMDKITPNDLEKFVASMYIYSTKYLEVVKIDKDDEFDNASESDFNFSVLYLVSENYRNKIRFDEPYWNMVHQKIISINSLI